MFDKRPCGSCGNRCCKKRAHNDGIQNAEDDVQWIGSTGIRRSFLGGHVSVYPVLRSWPRGLHIVAQSLSEGSSSIPGYA